MAWLIAYDISDRRRWRKVNGIVSEAGYRLQYSLYWLPVTDIELYALSRALEQAIDPTADDVRFYPLPATAWCRLYGLVPWNEEVATPFSTRFRTCVRDHLPVALGRNRG